MRRLLALALLLLCAAPALAWDASSPIQHGTISNTTASGTATNVARITLTGVAFRQWHIYSISAWCDPVGTASMSIKNGTSYMFKSSTSFVTSNTTVFTPSTAYSGSIGGTMFITVGPCPNLNIANVNVQADNF